MVKRNLSIAEIRGIAEKYIPTQIKKHQLRASVNPYLDFYFVNVLPTGKIRRFGRNIFSSMETGLAISKDGSSVNIIASIPELENIASKIAKALEKKGMKVSMEFEKKKLEEVV